MEELAVLSLLCAISRHFSVSMLRFAVAPKGSRSGEG
jgi:hypothetical protein